MIVYFSTKFTGCVPNTTLISIGCVAENGKKFYGEFLDYNIDLVDESIQKDILDHLTYTRKPIYDSDGVIIGWEHEFTDWLDELLADESVTYKGRDMMTMYRELEYWLSDLCPEDEKIQFVADTSHYNFRFLCDIFGGEKKLPKNVNPVCYDICQDIAMYLFMTSTDTIEESMSKAFSVSREEICEGLDGELPDGRKQNALYDAELTKVLYRLLSPTQTV